MVTTPHKQHKLCVDTGTGTMKRQRVERGIFGIKKDPKNQILFSFQARDGEEWPSDSDDSDYCPYDDDDETNYNKQKMKKTIKKKRKDNEKVEASTSGTSSNVKCSRLPAEIWSKILLEVVNTQGPLPFLCRAAKVCCMWRDIVSQPQFWRAVDLSYGWIKSKDSTLRWLVNNRLSQCESISLQSWGSLSDDVLQTLAEGCPRLTSINLSHCKKLGQQGLTTIIEGCQNLRDVNLAFSSIKMPIIKHLISKHGRSLRQLNISGNSFTGAVLDLIVANCPNIEQLDISNSTFSSEFAPIDVYTFQKGCPKIRVLNLGNSKFKEKVVRNNDMTKCPGFPHLEELSFGCLKVDNSAQITCDLLEKIAYESSKLRLVDLRGCKNIIMDADTLFLHSFDVEELYLSNSSIEKYGRYISHCLRQWWHSLRVLDLSKNKFRDDQLNSSLKAVLRGDDPEPIALEQINLEATDVSQSTIRLLIKRCPKLDKLNLSSCYGLPRGVKKEHSGRNIKKLLKLLDS